MHPRARLRSLTAALRRPGAVGRSLLFGAVLWLTLPRGARAEQSLTYKFQSWQEDDQRIRVDSHYLLVESDLTTRARFKLMGLIDSIAGATPSGQPPEPGQRAVPLSRMDERREAWEVDYAHQIARSNVALGYSQSRESDYESNGFSLNTLTDFNEKNTTLLLGYARTDDRIQTGFMPVARHKHGDDFVLGLTQLLDARTALTANVSFGRSTGFLSDPYKIVQRTVALAPGLSLPLTFPENRPESKDKWTGFLGLNHDVARWRGTLDASYRLYHDDYGITSHTLALEWYQQVGARLIVRPAVRLYRQSAAAFYFPDLDATSLLPDDAATGRAPFYSSDYRLARFDTTNLGMKIIWKVADWLTIDATYERYLMHGRDRRTAPSAFVDSDVFTLGVKVSR